MHTLNTYTNKVIADTCTCHGLALPHGAMGLSVVSDCGFPDHTHLLFLVHRPTYIYNCNYS